MTDHLNSDRELLLQIAAGDESAFQRIYDRHWNRIYSLALAYLKSISYAEDIVQEVFLKLWKRREQLPNVEKPDAFIFIMARNEVLNALKKKIKIATADIDVNETVPLSENIPHHTVDLKEMQQKIKVAIEKLPPQQQRIFKMSREEGLNHEQIAERLGIEKVTVKNHIVRALNTLRQHLQLSNNHLLFWFLLAEWFGNVPVTTLI